MAFWNSDARDIRRLTDVQLIHKLNDAISDREQGAATCGPGKAQRLMRRIPAWAPELAYIVVGLVHIRDALQGLTLAVSIASAETLAAWSTSREAHLRAMDEDIRILTLLREMERRARCASASSASQMRRT